MPTRPAIPRRGPARRLALPRLLVLALAALPSGACVTASPPPGAPADTPLLLPVGDDAQRFRADFDAAVGRPRFLAILSPTCGACLRGARAVSRHVIRNRLDGAPETFVVWGAVLPGDDLRSAQEAAHLVDAPGVHQFWDTDMTLGRRVGDAYGVAPQPFAWDLYAFFEWDATFTEEVPVPMAWAHQMGGAVPQRFRVLGDLDDFLRETTASLRRQSSGE